jgi:riboflavin kinase/FMN adenylyltransferase
MAFPVFYSVEEWASQFADARKTAVTVGTFDGLHVGHRKILESVRDRARTTGERASVVTFDPHPMSVVRPDRAPLMIQTLAQRLAGFEAIGLDAVLVLRFDRSLSLVTAEEFIAGDVRLLGERGKRDGFEVKIISPVEVGGQIVSSTAIRGAIASGDVAGAIPMLGRPFSLTGGIRAGAGRGRTILFPTLNLAAEQELLPKLGVYATECAVGGKLYAAVTNVGTRPTFDGAGITVESHLFGFSGAVTGGPMEVRFHARLRDEQKFSGPEALRAQIARDIEAARNFFSEKTLAGHSPPD